MVGMLSAAMAVLVVPALLAWLGPNINKWSIRRGPAVSDASTGWLRLARGVMRGRSSSRSRRPWSCSRSPPPCSARTSRGRARRPCPRGSSPTASTSTSAPLPACGHRGHLPDRHRRPSDTDLAALRGEIADVDHVVSVTPFARTPDNVAYATAAFDVPALDEARRTRWGDPCLDVARGQELLVTGNTARFIDQKDSLASNAPLVIAVIVLLTLVLLFLLTGSVLLPFKTLLMNALTLSTTLGILVIVFEKKVGSSLLDYPGPYSVEVTSMVFLFVVTFALATDYAVLVMARIKELRDSGLDNEEAVAQGMARTGRIISAAAVMIAVVFAAFAVSPVFFMKQIAVGMALAVLIDATIVRALLVPSLMRLLGEANWWAPGPLRRLHDRFGIREG
jgi:hypothetical protein